MIYFLIFYHEHSTLRIFRDSLFFFHLTLYKIGITKTYHKVDLAN